MSEILGPIPKWVREYVEKLEAENERLRDLVVALTSGGVVGTSTNSNESGE